MKPHVEGFLQIARLARVELLGGNRPVAAVVSGLGDVDPEFLFGGLGEEGLRRTEQGVDALGADGMADDIEEAPFAAGAVDLFGDGGPG